LCVFTQKAIKRQKSISQQIDSQRLELEKLQKLIDDAQAEYNAFVNGV